MAGMIPENYKEFPTLTVKQDFNGDGHVDTLTVKTALPGPQPFSEGATSHSVCFANYYVFEVDYGAEKPWSYSAGETSVYGHEGKARKLSRWADKACVEHPAFTSLTVEKANPANPNDPHYIVDYTLEGVPGKLSNVFPLGALAAIQNQ